MAQRKDVEEFFKKAQEIFWERNAKYGTKGMTLEKAVSLAKTKLDRVEAGELVDSPLDLANYGLIAHLLATGKWFSDTDGLRVGTQPSSKAILVKKTSPEHDGIHPPKKQGDVGYDLVSSEDFVLPPHGNASSAFTIPAGVHIKSPDGHFCVIVGRSSAAKRGIGVQLAVLDNGYTGPMFACCFNMTPETIEIKKGERIAQAVFLPMCVFPLMEVTELPITERGETGFGSTNP